MKRKLTKSNIVTIVAVLGVSMILHPVLLLPAMVIAYVWFRVWAESPQAYPDVRCPYCGVTGHVKIRFRKVKSGISGAKATGAVLTGGLSVAATGLSRKTTQSQAGCGHCGVKWNIPS